jgi:hypothetical protein
MHRKRSRPRFSELPRHRRADAVFALRHRIAEGPFRNFASWDVFGDGLSWADIYFIGRDKFTLWNATVRTASMARADLILEVAFDQTWNALTPEQRALRPGLTWEKLPGGYSRMVSREEPKFDHFDGRDFFEQEDHIAATLDPDVYAEYRIDHSYVYGTGLNVVLDVPLLTPAVLEEFVDGFAANPREWRSDEPCRVVDAPVYHSNYIDVDA